MWINAIRFGKSKGTINIQEINKKNRKKKDILGPHAL